MAKTIQLPNDVYERIKRFKKDLSFSEAISLLLEEFSRQKKISKDEFMERMAEIESRFKGRAKENVSERIDDLIWR